MPEWMVDMSGCYPSASIENIRKKMEEYVDKERNSLLEIENKPYEEFTKQAIKLISNKIHNDLLELLKEKNKKIDKERDIKIYCSHCGKSTIITV